MPAHKKPPVEALSLDIQLCHKADGGIGTKQVRFDTVTNDYFGAFATVIDWSMRTHRAGRLS